MSHLSEHTCFLLSSDTPRILCVHVTLWPNLVLHSTVHVLKASYSPLFILLFLYILHPASDLEFQQYLLFTIDSSLTVIIGSCSHKGQPSLISLPEAPTCQTLLQEYTTLPSIQNGSSKVPKSLSCRSQDVIL